MDGRIEKVLPPLKGVRVSAGAIMALDHERLLARLRQKGGRGETAHTASDDDDVVCLLPGLSPDAHEIAGNWCLGRSYRAVLTTLR